MKPLLLKDHIEKLYPFKIVCDLGGITAASRTLGLSQSSLSHTMKALEEILEVRLLNRLPRGVALTAEGEVLYEFSKRMFHQADNVELKVKNMSQKFHGVLKVSTHETLAIHLWPSFIQSLQAKFPGLKVSLMSGRIDAIMNDVLNSNVDVALTVEPFAHAKLVKAPVVEMDFGFYVAFKPEYLESYPVLQKKMVRIEDLDDVPILTDVHAHIRQGLTIPQYLSSSGLRMKNAFTLNSFEAAIHLCAKGVGVATMPRSAAKAALQEKKIRELKVRGLKAKPFGRSIIHVSYLKESKNRMLEPFIQELNQFVGKAASNKIS